MTTRLEDMLQDSRTPWFSAHSIFDEIEWSPEAYRVYGHLCRRAGQRITAFPSYASIGKTCFKKAITEGSLSEKSARSKAMRAVQELLDLGMLKRTRRSHDGQNESNLYTLTHTTEWTFLRGVVMSDDQGGDVTSLGVVMSDDQGGDVTSPKGIPIKVFQLEGSNTPIVPSEESSRIGSDPSGVGVALLQTAEDSSHAIANSTPESDPVNSGECQRQKLADFGLGFESKGSAAPSDSDFEPTPQNYSEMRVRTLRQLECQTAAEHNAIAKRPKILDHYGLTHYWAGPGRNDFAEDLVRGTIRHLQSCPNGDPTRVGANNWIRKRLGLLRRDDSYEMALGDLEQRFDGGKPCVGTGEAPQSSAAPEENRYDQAALFRLMGVA